MYENVWNNLNRMIRRKYDNLQGGLGQFIWQEQLFDPRLIIIIIYYSIIIKKK